MNHIPGSVPTDLAALDAQLAVGGCAAVEKSPFVLRREYGELVEGWQRTQAAIRMAIMAGDLAACRELAEESRDWSAVMRVCRMFVGGDHG